jgi:tripartite-type tricarboxylate transporter receptor subunit TctC
MRQSIRLAFTAAFGALLAVSGAAQFAQAQSYPSRPITLVVPYPAGGPTDTIARVMVDKMRAILGQSVVVENVTGAGGSIGTGRVAHAPPDGYTVSLGHNQTHVLNGATLTLSYDVLKDFEPVSLIADTPIWIVAKKSLPANNYREYIAWLKQLDGKANAGQVGTAGPADVAVAAFQQQTGTKFQSAVYRGGAPVLQDLLAGHIDFTFGQAATYLNYVRNGQLKAYAVLTEKRWWAAPDVPTLDELGVPGIHAGFWHGMWLPKGTPQEIVAKLNAAVVETLADPTVKQRLTDVGQDIVPREQQNPTALGTKQKAEIEKWWPVVKAAGIKGQ